MKYGASSHVITEVGVAFGLGQISAKFHLSKCSSRVLFIRISRHCLKMFGREIDLRLNESNITLLKLNNISVIVNLYVHVLGDVGEL